MVHRNLVNKLSDLIQLLAYQLNVENLEVFNFKLDIITCENKALCIFFVPFGSAVFFLQF